MKSRHQCRLNVVLLLFKSTSIKSHPEAKLTTLEDSCSYPKAFSYLKKKASLHCNPLLHFSIFSEKERPEGIMNR